MTHTGAMAEEEEEEEEVEHGGGGGGGESITIAYLECVALFY